MRQTLDKIYTYEGVGTFFNPLTRPRDMICHAIYEFVERFARSGPTKARTAALIGQARGFDRGKVVEAIDRAHALLKNTSYLIAISKILFSGGNSDYVWKDRHFSTVRDALYGGMQLRKSQPVGGAPIVRAAASFVSSTTPDERKMMADVIMALWCDYGIVEWRDDLYATRKIDTIAIAYDDVPLLVAESLIKQIDPPKPKRAAGQRVMFGSVFQFLEEATRHIAMELNSIGVTTHFAGRITDAVAFSMRTNDPALPHAPFAALTSAVNFIVPGHVRTSFTMIEALTIAPLVERVTSALAKAPHVRVRSTREYIDMFDVRRIMAERTNASVLTLVTRRYSDERKPARMIDHLPMKEIGIDAIDPVSDAPGVPALDATTDALFDLFAEPVIDEAFASFSEADAQRALISPVDEEELVALAACLAGEVEYTTAEASPDADLSVQFAFRFDDKITGWEDLVVTSIDGVAITDDWRSVLRLASPYTGKGRYVVADGLSEALSAGRSITIVNGFEKAWIEGGKEYQITVSYPVFAYSATQGMQVVDIAVAPNPVAMTALTLLNLAPMRSHALAISPATRRRLTDAALLFTLARDLVTMTTVPTYVSIVGVDLVLNPFFRDDPVGLARREATASQLTILYTDAIIKFLTSAPARLAYSQAVMRAGARAQKPVTVLEAKAYLDTVQSYLSRFVVPLLKLPDEFTSMYNALRSDPQFDRLAFYEILHPGRRI